MKFTQIRHSSHMITFNNKTFAIDPVYADKGTTFALPKGRVKEKNPLVPMPFDTSFINTLDGVFITHTHFDHFDEAAIGLLAKDIEIYCHPSESKKIKKSGFTNVISIDKEMTIHGDIHITTASGKHGTGLAGKLMGRTTGYVFTDLSQNADKEPTTYIMGDTIWYNEVRDVIKEKQPNVIIAFAGEARLPFGDNITMSTKDIHQLATAATSSKIIVTHLDTWNHCYLTRDILKSFLANKPYDKRVLVPNDGESYMFASEIL